MHTDHINLLAGIYERWTAKNGLPLMSADEQLFENENAEQSAWLKRFLEIWERNEELQEGETWYKK